MAIMGKRELKYDKIRRLCRLVLNILFNPFYADMCISRRYNSIRNIKFSLDLISKSNILHYFCKRLSMNAKRLNHEKPLSHTFLYPDDYNSLHGGDECFCRE